MREISKFVANCLKITNTNHHIKRNILLRNELNITIMTRCACWLFCILIAAWGCGSIAGGCVAVETTFFASVEHSLCAFLVSGTLGSVFIHFVDSGSKSNYSERIRLRFQGPGLARTLRDTHTNVMVDTHDMSSLSQGTYIHPKTGNHSNKYEKKNINFKRVFTPDHFLCR